MNDIRKKYLKEIYDDYINGKEFTLIRFTDNEQPIINYLLDSQYIKEINYLMDGGLYTMTSKGIDFVENGCTEIPQTSGSIIINGSNNTVSNNFNTVTNNINNSDIDENLKAELINFINELEATKDDKPTTTQKITSFVSNIITRATTDVAVYQLTVLISSFFFNH